MVVKKIEWVLVNAKGEVVHSKSSLYEALQWKTPDLEIQIQVLAEIRNPTHAEMAEALGLPEWADAVSGGN